MRTGVRRFQGTIVEAGIEGQQIRFFVSNPNDVIQEHHNQGMFYEKDELMIIRRWWRHNGTFVDIGANVGNHAIYVSKFLRPQRIVVFEPNMDAIGLLQVNVSLNLCDNIDLRYLGVALSDKEERLSARISHPDNLGGVYFVSDERGTIPSVMGDVLLFSEIPRFLKIDVEGMELRVLAGLRKTIETWRPSIFIEVQEEHKEQFLDWCSCADYIVREQYKRYPENINFMLEPGGVP